MPRRTIPNTSLPRRPDRRRNGGNATGAQRRRRRRRGQTEAIAERRARVMELRKTGLPYRAIATLVGVDVHTVHADVQAELAALREETVGQAEELRTLELQRLDAMNVGLWPQIEKGNPPAVHAGVRVSERRSRLLGLDAPIASTTELTGRISVEAEVKYKAEKDALLRLDVAELQALLEESDALMARALAMAETRRTGLTVPALPPAAQIVQGESDAHVVAMDAPEIAEPPTESTSTPEVANGPARVSVGPD